MQETYPYGTAMKFNQKVFYSEDRGTKFIRNFNNVLPEYTNFQARVYIIFVNSLLIL
jgi:hypothetical protein